MKRLLLLLFLSVTQLSYSKVFLEKGFSDEDTLSIRETVGVNALPLSGAVSSNFLDKLEDKFPEENSTKYSYSNISSQPEFNWEYINNTYSLPELVFKQREAARESFAEIEDSGLWLDNFSNENIIALPVGVKHIVDNVEYAIGIVKAEINPEYTTLTAFARVTIQQSDEEGDQIELFFGADDVKLSHQGGIIGDAKLVLLGDVPIPFNGGNWLIQFNGGFDYRTGITPNLTYATIDCNGVKDLGLNGAIAFSRNMILPIEPNGEVDPAKTTTQRPIQTRKGFEMQTVPNRVRGDFNIVIENWNDILVDISLQPFVKAKKRNGKNYDGNFQFFLNEAVLDFSDLRNSPSIYFPEYYHEHGLLLPNANTWKGVYVNTLDVRLPKEFKTKETIRNNERIGFGAHDLIIDSYGISGILYADNLFTLDQGRTNKEKAWAYSVDHIQIELAANHLVGAEFNGRILLPISKENNENGTMGLRYAGLITQEEYGLKVANDSIINFDLWKAEGQLEPNSSIELKVVENQFKPKAILHGKLAISANQKSTLEAENDYENQLEQESEESTVEFRGIRFQQLVLQTDNPVFSVDYLGYEDQVKFANFPVSIANIGLTSQNNRSALWFDLRINLMDGAGFGAETTLGILAQNIEEDYRQQWRYDGLDLKEIFVQADFGGFSFDGGLRLMQDDPEYGDGFSANLNVELGGRMQGVEIEAKGIFGRVEDYRYWYFDAKVDMPALESAPSIIVPTGFAGGAYYKMERSGFSSDFSPSGLSYVPNAKRGLGLKAMIQFNAAGKGVINGRAGFEIAFNSTGGINRMGLYGEAEFMKNISGGQKIDDLMEKVKAHEAALDDYLGASTLEAKSWAKPFLEKAEFNFPSLENIESNVKARMGIEYDFENQTLHGELDVYVNIGKGVIQGRASRGRAGWAVLHFAPDQWYVHMGTPTDRLGLKIGVGSFRVDTGGYFMIGDYIPDSPPPPPIVAEILGEDIRLLDYMRDENALEEGRGFAFGADFSLDTGDLNMLIFYARFQAGVGMDIMLKDYGGAACANRGSEQIGINGWYANGQAYAYLQGELGINIKLFFIRKKIPIIKGGAAVLLQAKAPNPVWMRGYVGGHFNLLGGLVKGKFRFKLVIGEECEFIDASPLGGMKIITDLTPQEGNGDVDVFTAPQATFSMRVNEPIVIPEDEGDKTYKIVLEKYRILHNGKEIPGTLKWGSNNDRATFISTDILPPDEQLKVEVEVSFQERKNGVFKTIMVDGQKAIESEIRNFKTGEAPTAIPLQNIRYAYPVIGQKYFLKNEYDKGYIQLLRGQDYLFDLAQWTTEIVFTDENGKEFQAGFNYHTGDNKVYYQLPNIGNLTKYKLSITSRTISKGVTRNKKDEYRTVSMQGGNDVNIRQNSADVVVKDGEIDRLSYEFTSSRYNTFKQKIRNINTTDNNWGKIYSDVIFLTNQVQSDEAFDLAELTGNNYTENKPLVKVEATLEDDYFRKDMNPALYGQYPLGNNYGLVNREESEYGIPPKKAVPIVSHYLTSVEHNVDQNWLLRTFPYYYNLPLAYKQDWVDLRSQILNDWVDGNLSPGSRALQFLDADYRFMRYGSYTVNMQYILPGGIKGTNYEYDFKNENRFR